MRTGTLVSTARMAFLHVRADTFFKFVQVLRGRSAIREYRLMDVLGRVLPDSANDDVFALFVPFQNGARTDPELLTNPSGYGYLPLSCNLRLSYCHQSI